MFTRIGRSEGNCWEVGTQRKKGGSKVFNYQGEEDQNSTVMAEKGRPGGTG